MRAMLLAVLLAAAAAGPARAEIYTWRDASGASQMSNFPPQWYSSSEPSRIRTRVLLNGQIVDDTGLPQAEREKLQSRRANAERWSKPRAAPAAAPTPAAQTAPVAAVPGLKPGQPVKTSDIPAASLEGFKRALEAQNRIDDMAEQLNAAGRPK